jgi:hypothetical protein
MHGPLVAALAPARRVSGHAGHSLVLPRTSAQPRKIAVFSRVFASELLTLQTPKSPHKMLTGQGFRYFSVGFRPFSQAGRRRFESDRPLLTQPLSGGRNRPQLLGSQRGWGRRRFRHVLAPDSMNANKRLSITLPQCSPQPVPGPALTRTTLCMRSRKKAHETDPLR